MKIVKEQSARCVGVVWCSVVQAFAMMYGGHTFFNFLGFLRPNAKKCMGKSSISFVINYKKIIVKNSP
jgi:hypothetical protein